MCKSDFEDKSVDEITILKAKNKELEERNFQLQLENDVLKEARKILKNYHALSLSEDLKSYTNLEKTKITNNLRAKYKLTYLLKILELSSSSYYKTIQIINKPDKYQEVRQKIVELFYKIKSRYGVKRLWKELNDRGTKVGRDVVRKIMRQENLTVFVSKCKKLDTYDASKDTSYAPNLIERNFNSEKPFEKMVTDITQFSIPAGKIYLSPIVDLYDHSVIAWSISANTKTTMCLKMLKQLKKYKLSKYAVLHSDRGCQYHSKVYEKTLEKMDILQSMSKKGCSPDNAACEGFFGRLKREFFHNTNWANISRKKFIVMLNDYIIWYNNDRIMLKHGGISPNALREKEGYQLVA